MIRIVWLLKSLRALPHIRPLAESAGEAASMDEQLEPARRITQKLLWQLVRAYRGW